MADEVRDEPILSPKEPVLPDQPTLPNELALLDAPVLPDEPVRSTEVWYDDGTLVLCAENTLFRVYRGVLAAQSEVFRDMLSVPQPPGTDGDMFEGCPLVHMQETVDDMTCFLHALLEPRYFSRECRRNVTRIVSTFRLATKYNAEELREYVIAHLQGVFPLSSLYDYDVAQDVRWDFGAAELVTLTNLAYEFELDRLWKPLALTCAVDLDHQQILDGTKETIGASIRLHLSARAKRDVLRVRAGILEHLQDFFRSWTFPDRLYTANIPTAHKRVVEHGYGMGGGQSPHSCSANGCAHLPGHNEMPFHRSVHRSYEMTVATLS